MTTVTATTTQVYRVFIRATPEAIWDAITKPEFTAQYFYGMRIEVTPERRRTIAPNEEDATLHRLERDGLVKSRWTAASGRRRRVYRITRSGREALAVRRLEWKQFSRAVEAVLA
jgi:uncharacterized protein YndB with AHSA1/START domain